MTPGALAFGYALEILVGDPEGWPHPVRGVGRLIERGESLARRLLRSRRLAGAGLVAMLLVVTVTPVVLARWVLLKFSPSWVFLFDGLILYLALSLNQLLREGWSLYRLLTSGDIPAARRNLSRLVSRRTAELDESEIVKATVETLAENFSDGFLAPLFYFLLFGPAGAVAYKVINTLDSMIGYRTERYIEFGWAAARMDDVVNWIPARLAGAILVLTAPLSGFNPGRALAVLVRDGRKHESPNAGIGKAAVAGAIGVRIGGPAVYEDGVRDRAFIGDERRPLKSAIILDTVRLLATAGAVTAFGSLAVVICFR